MINGTVWEVASEAESSNKKKQQSQGVFQAVSCENNQLVSSSKLTGLPSSKCKKAKEKQGDSSSVKGEL